MPSAASNSIERRKVPSVLIPGSAIFLVGEAPGQTENALGYPFCGQAGEELNNHLRYAGLDRGAISVGNLARYWPLCDARGKQLPPSAADIQRDESELLMELAQIQPRIVAAVGAHASRYFLGARFDSLFKNHGIPLQCEWGEFTVVPCIHPAAALHSQSQEERARVAWDFLQLGRLYRNELPPRVNAHPNPQYRELSGPEGAALLAEILAGKTLISLDTEGTVVDPECVTITVRAGEGWLVQAHEHECLAVLNRHINAPYAICTVECHYLGHDIPVLKAMNVDVVKHRARNADGSLTLRCTMSELFLLGGIEPKGLKPAVWRNCSMDQEDYADVVGETEERNTREYFEQAYTALQCPRCLGLGKLAEEWRYINPECLQCFGGGRVPGKRPLSLKWCYCTKMTDRCSEPCCVDGLFVPMPDKELVLERGEFRWKQPQSVARWMRRRLEKQATYNEEEDEAEGENIDSSEEQTGEERSAHFKLRRDWAQLPPARRALIEATAGRLPRTRLFSVPDKERVRRYACGDADAGFRVGEVTEERLRGLGLLRCREIDAAVIPMLSRIEQLGMPINREHYSQLSVQLDVKMRETREELSQLLGAKINPNSPDIAKVLFGELGLPVIKLTKSGARESIDDDVLSTLRVNLMQDPRPESQIGVAVCGLVQDFREFMKLKGYADAMNEYADSNDRIHCTVNYATVATGRLSFSDPINLSTLPNPDNSPVWGKAVRDGVEAPEGYSLCEVDFAQIEMVYGAHLSQDANLCMLLHEGKDLHWGALAFMEDADQWRAHYEEFISKKELYKPRRTTIKPVNFGSFYGMGPDKLQMTLAALPSGAVLKTLPECEEIISKYFRDFAPGVMEWKRKLWAQGRIDGFVREPLSGRIRWATGLRSDIKKVRSAAEREAANMPVQGGAQAIMKIAMDRIWEFTLPALWAEGIDAEVIMQNHDALLTLAPTEHAELVGWMIGEEMRNAVQLSVPVKVSVKIGKKWGSL